jgi:hypothetical protein
VSNKLHHLIGPPASLANLQSGAKARQVSTHSHDAVPRENFSAFHGVGHWDFKSIPPNASWSFPEMEGPGCITSVWLTMAGRFRDIILRNHVPEHRYLWINVYYDSSDIPAVSAPVGHFFGNGTVRFPRG